MKQQVDLDRVVNGILFIVGMIGVWFTTRSLVAMLWTFIAALHFHEEE